MINIIKNVIKKNKVIYRLLININNVVNNLINDIKLKININLYRCSKYRRELKKLKNKHYGERCFIIGNGPSLTIEDLELLDNEITFAANKIYRIFSKTKWRPTYYCAQDFILINQIKEEIKKIKCKEKFIAINTKWLYKIKFNDCKYFYLNIEEYERLPKFSRDVTKEIFEGYTVTYAMIQLANYLGFKEIYLIGVDHNYSKVIDSKGNITCNNDVKDYFMGDSNWEVFNLPNLDKSTSAYVKSKKFARENGINIFNATRGGKLEVFKRVDLNEIIKKTI